jgi:DNA-binding response OmpR family regulator
MTTSLLSQPYPDHRLANAPVAVASPGLDVMIVDDDTTFLEEMAEFISRQGANVLTTSDPEEALALISRRKPSLVFMDIRMPRFNGTRITQMALALDYRTQIVLMTGSDDEFYHVAELGLPVAGLIKKPFSWHIIAPYLELIDEGH